MKREDLFKWIDLQPEIVRQLNQIGGSLDLEALEPHLKRLSDRKTAAQAYRDLKALFKEDSDHLQMLYCHLECARRAFDRYEAKHIPQTIYVDTMKCFTRFIEECGKKNGRLFFDRGWWTYRQVSMSLFRIGELEYEFTSWQGENVIGLHIPSDADFSEAAVDASLKQAKAFFQTYFGDYHYDKYTCGSWLISPALTPLLSGHSNILSFQKRFHVVSEDGKDREFIEWLFEAPIDTDYETLPADTGLRRKVRELLLNGKTIGSAYGIMKDESMTGKAAVCLTSGNSPVQCE